MTCGAYLLVAAGADVVSVFDISLFTAPDFFVTFLCRLVVFFLPDGAFVSVVDSDFSVLEPVTGLVVGVFPPAFGLAGARRSFMPASSGVRFPFRTLQGRQAQTTFSQLEGPFRERGTTWSRESSDVEWRLPQYWQRFPSRM